MQAGEELFGNHLLNFEYILFDVNRYTDVELLSLANTIGAAFLLDKGRREPEEFQKLLNNLFATLQNASETELNMFARWIRYIFYPNLPVQNQELLEKNLNQLNKMELINMVFEGIKGSLRAFEEQGRKKGLQEGRVEVQIETAREMLRDKVAPDKVAKYTKLPLDKIQELTKKI